MGLIQQMKGDNQTFSEHERHTMSLALHEGTDSQRIDIVFDVYRELSIKTAERYHREAITGSELQEHSRRSQNPPMEGVSMQSIQHKNT